jgi:hypothetical protein
MLDISGVRLAQICVHLALRKPSGRQRPIQRLSLVGEADPATQRFQI